MKNRIIIVALCVILSALALTSAFSATAATFIVEGDWKLEIPSAVNDYEYYIEKYIGSDSQVEIPEDISGKAIVKINSLAFESVEVTSCYIPESVTVIDDYAFMSCDSLTTVNLPSTLTYLGDGAYSNCTSLTTVTASEIASFDYISASCFSGCTSLKNITIPYGVESIYSYAFLDCSNLRKVVIPPSVTDIAPNAFKNCGKLILYVYNDSYAAEYAKENKIPYIYLGDFVVPTTATETTVPETTDVTETTVSDPVESSTAVITESSVPGSSIPEESTAPTTTGAVVTDPSEGETTAASTVYYMGDADFDKRITVKDATVIRKFIVHLVSFNDTQVMLSDVDKNEDINIKDATQIQKYVAGFSGIPYVGDEVIA